MTQPEGRPLRFGCPQCMARLRARLSQAGTMQRCPQCGHQFMVPTLEQAAVQSRRAEAYAVLEGDYQPGEGEAADTAAVADCPRCGTRVYGPEHRIGHPADCPDCGTKLVLARRPEPRAPKRRPADEDTEAGYAIRQDADQPAGSPVVADQVEIPVYCPVCNTLLYGTPDLVGKHILCPDCHTPVEVPPPKAGPSKPTATHSVDDEYALQVDTDPPAGGAGPPREPLIPVVCSLCETRMHATRDQVGEMITCPDCGTPVVVPRPKTTPKPGRAGTTAGEYAAGEPDAGAESGARATTRRVGTAPGDRRAEDGAAPDRITRARTAGPRWPMVRGIVSFPFYPSVWRRSLTLTVLLLAILPLGALANYLLGIPNMGAGVAPLWIAAMIFLVTTLILLFLWGIVAAPMLLAIAQDTGEGNGQIEVWPESNLGDRVYEFFFLVDSFVVAFLPGVILARVLSVAGLPHEMAIPGSLFLVFPVALLSMLEAGSPLVPLSASVVASLFTRSWVWLVFYIETAVLLIGFLAFCGALVWSIGVWGQILIVPALVWVLIVYCRLLGRVAWCCGAGYRESAGDPRELAAPPPAEAPPPAPAARPKRPEAPGPAPRPAPPETPAPSSSPSEAQPIGPAPPQASTQEPSPTQEQRPPQKRGRSILDDDFDFS